LVKEPRDPLAQQDRVLADHYSHGITALSLVPPPAGLVTQSSPPSAATRSERPRRPLPSRVAPPAPSSPTSTTIEPSASVTSTSARLAPSAWRATFVRASATTK